MAQFQSFFNTHKPKSTTGIFAHFLEQITRTEGRAIDLCCGTGGLTEALQQRGLTAYGVDIASQFIGTEGQSAEGYVLADVNHLPFASHQAQVVCCVDSLQYFEQPELIIAEMARLLSADGQLVISTQCNTNPAGLKKWVIQRLTGRTWSPWLEHPVENFITYDWLMRTLEANGFEVEYVRGKQFLTAWVSVLPQGIRNWSPTGKSWHSLASLAGRMSLPRWIEESVLSRFAMIVLVSARKQ